MALTIIVVKLLAGSYAYSNATLSPDPSTHHTAAVFSHGRTVYLTPAQIDREGIFHWSNLVLVGLVSLAVAQKIHQRRRARKDDA